MNSKNPNRIKNIFLGSPEIGAIILKKLLENGVNIEAVITRPDKPQGRGKKIEKTPVKILAEEKGLKVFQPLTKEEFVKTIKEIEPDLGIIAAFGMIIPKEALELPKHGMINFHPSLLPKYRGPAPIPAAILAGDKKTGVTIIEVTEKMDAGDILAQKEITLNGKETTPELSEKLANLGAEMLTQLIRKIESSPSNLPRKVQNEKIASYTKFISKDQGRIDWKKMTAKEIERMSRAFTPWPGIYTYWNNKKIDLYDIEVANKKVKPGQVKREGKKIIIGCRNNSISVSKIKIEGKSKISSEEFIRGYPDFIDTNLN